MTHPQGPLRLSLKTWRLEKKSLHILFNLKFRERDNVNQTNKDFKANETFVAYFSPLENNVM